MAKPDNSAVLLNYDRPGIMFLHCKHCLKEFYSGGFGDGQSPSEAMNYEVSAYPLALGKRKFARIIVVWCKRCKRSVWDSRHLLRNG